MTFLRKMVESLECRESVEKIIKESTVFFTNEQEYDANPVVFQLVNCVLDLLTNTFRKGRPSDLTTRYNTITVPTK